MTLSMTGTVVMVAVIAAAVAVMILVLARANRRNQHTHSEPHRTEHAEMRVPGADPDALHRQADLAGDDSEQSVEPGGHVIRRPDR